MHECRRCGLSNLIKCTNVLPPRPLSHLQVAIIHTVSSNTAKERVDVDTGTYFGALWDGSYPQASSNCGGIGCTVHDNTCICPATVATTQVFDGSSAPLLSDILSELHIGATDPNLFDADHYTQCTAVTCLAQSYLLDLLAFWGKLISPAVMFLSLEFLYLILNPPFTT